MTTKSTLQHDLRLPLRDLAASSLTTMKKELRRIEETLHQLTHPAPSSPGAEPQSASASAQRSLSFTVSPRPATASAPPPAVTTEGAHSEPASTLPEFTDLANPVNATATLQSPSNLATESVPPPSLPKLKVPSFSSHRNTVNPALATNLLQDIQTIVGGWQRELSQIVRQIQDLYQEGPIIDGWLESHTTPAPPDAPVLRHGEVDHLMNYVEAICAAPAPETTPDYRLCGLNQAGQLWSSPCPPDQVPNLSLAIARHQKLRQLLARQQYLEMRLSKLAEKLVVMHGQLAE
jgi:hypothetical protein